MKFETSQNVTSCCFWQSLPTMGIRSAHSCFLGGGFGVTGSDVGWIRPRPRPESQTLTATWVTCVCQNARLSLSTSPSRALWLHDDRLKSICWRNHLTLLDKQNQEEKTGLDRSFAHFPMFSFASLDSCFERLQFKRFPENSHPNRKWLPWPKPGLKLDVYFWPAVIKP